MQNFYTLPKYKQWIISIVLLMVGFALCTPIFLLPYGFLLIPFFAPILNLATVPFFRLIGYFKYLNPLVISTVQTNKTYDLHNVFTFDYFVNFKWSDRGTAAQKKILGHYFKALQIIIERIENGELSPEVSIVGHSYFFNNRTAEKFGFNISDASLFWKLNSCFQFIELSYLYSFSQGKLAFPNFWKVKKAEIKGNQLVLRKDLIAKTTSRLLN